MHAHDGDGDGTGGGVGNGGHGHEFNGFIQPLRSLSQGATQGGPGPLQPLSRETQRGVAQGHGGGPPWLRRLERERAWGDEDPGIEGSGWLEPGPLAKRGTSGAIPLRKRTRPSQSQSGQHGAGGAAAAAAAAQFKDAFEGGAAVAAAAAAAAAANGGGGVGVGGDANNTGGIGSPAHRIKVTDQPNIYMASPAADSRSVGSRSVGSRSVGKLENPAKKGTRLHRSRSQSDHANVGASAAATDALHSARGGGSTARGGGLTARSQSGTARSDGGDGHQQGDDGDTTANTSAAARRRSKVVRAQKQRARHSFLNEAGVGMALDRETYQTRRQKNAGNQQEGGGRGAGRGRGMVGEGGGVGGGGPGSAKPTRRYERRRSTATTGALSPIRATLRSDFKARAMF